MSTLVLRTLGAADVTLDGQKVTGFRSAKAHALLIYLACHREQAHTRDALIGLFWPDQSQESAQTNLRQSLSRLQSAIHNKTVDPPFVLVGREQVQINLAADVRLDADEFQAARRACAVHGMAPSVDCPLCLTHHRAAADLYGGDFLAHFDCDSPEFDLWAEGMRAGLHQQALSTLDLLAAGYTAQGDHAAALQVLSHQLALEPWREEAYRGQMEILARQGDRAGALAVYARCRAVLEEELGAPPAPETEALYRRIEAAGAGRPHHLPVQTTSFVGRERELAQVLQAVSDPRRRLLTLVGPGGIGKTRLALEAAWRAVDDQVGPFWDGVFFVSLAGVTSANYLSTALADALDLTLSGSEEPEAQLLAYLRRRDLLLVLDNFEHLMEAGVRLFGQILQTAPGVHFLVTSRERLNLAEEWVYEVRGLALPPATLDTGSLTMETLRAYGATGLFLDRAAQVAPDFSPPPGSAELAAVARICRLLEGMPLALELAAAWVHMLPCAELADELARNLDFLSAAHRDLPSRHRSLRAVFDHSWAQLGKDDQEALARLTIFPSEFDRTAANRVTQAALPGLASLVNKSLVQVVTAGRYRLHDLVRQFAAEKLDDDARLLLRDAHAGYFAGWLAGLEGDLFGAGQRRALELVQTDIENVRAGWLWSVAHAKPQWVGQALRSLYQFYYIRCWTDEATEMLQYAEEMLLEELAAQGGAEHAPDRAIERSRATEITLGHLLVQLGNAHYSASRLGQAESYLARGLAYCSRYSELATVEVYGRQELGLTYYAQGDYTRAQTFLAEALCLARQLNLAHHEAHTGLGLGVVELALGHWGAAQDTLAAALAAYESLAYQWGVAHAQRWVGLAAWQTGDLAQAEAALHRARDLCQAIGDRTGEALALNDLGALVLAVGDLDACRALLQQSWEMAQADQNHMLRSRVLRNLGCLLRAEGQLDDAQRHFLRAIQGALTAQTTQLVLEIVLEVAQMWQALGRQEDAAPLFAVVAAHPAAVHAIHLRAAEGAARTAAPQPLPTLDELVGRLLEASPIYV